MFHLVVVTPERVLFDGMASSLIVPGSEGYLEILSHHMSLLTAVKHGRLTATLEDGQKLEWAVASGFLEVSHNQVNLLADSAELAHEIDVERAQEALNRAKKQLHSTSPEINRQRANQALQRAKNRLKIKGVPHS
jgi:F-type H+-transporting ATPase subunit epsilon